MKQLFKTLCLVISALLMASCAMTPSSAVEEYVDNLKNKEYEAIIDNMAFKAPPTEQQRAQFISILEEKVGKDYDKHGGISDCTILSETLTSDTTATVKYVITFSDGETREAEDKLIQRDGKWLMDGGK